MKKLLCFLMIFCLAGCSVTDIPEKTDINISKIESETVEFSKNSSSEVMEETVSSKESSSESLSSETFSSEKSESESKAESSSVVESENTASEEGVFSSYGELAGYLSGNPELREFFMNENGMICLCVPENLPEKYKLNSIKIHGSYITYSFENSENPAEIFKLEWPFKVTDAEKFLQNSLNFTYSEIAERPGSYVSSVYSSETGEREAFKIIWVEDGFCFSAIVSEEILEGFKNGTNLIKKEIYN